MISLLTLIHLTLCQAEYTVRDILTFLARDFILCRFGCLTNLQNVKEELSLVAQFH